MLRLPLLLQRAKQLISRLMQVIQVYLRQIHWRQLTLLPSKADPTRNVLSHYGAPLVSKVVCRAQMAACKSGL